MSKFCNAIFSNFNCLFCLIVIPSRYTLISLFINFVKSVMSYMLILSKMKSFFSNLFRYKNSSNSLLKGEVAEALGIDNNKLNIKNTEEGIVININGIDITITEDKDLTIKGVRFLEFDYELFFMKAPHSNKLKELYLKDKLVENFQGESLRKAVLAKNNKNK